MEEKKNTNATIALVGGIVSIVLFFLSTVNDIVGVFFSIVGIGLGITAIVCGSKGKKITLYKGMAKAGFVCGIIGVCLCPISFLGCVSNLQAKSIYSDNFTNIQDTEYTEDKVGSDELNKKDENTTSMTIGQKNALRKAKSYLSYSAFSREGLIKQLEFEKFSNEDAVYAVDNVGANWNEQALKKAKSYLSYSAFSKEGLIKQLEFEGFTIEQTNYAIDNIVVDWKEQAVKKAKSYLSYSAFSKEGLISQLEFEGFTYEEAVYGVEQNGY